MTDKSSGDPGSEPRPANSPQRPRQRKALLAEIGGGALLPGDPNGPAGPSDPAELAKAEDRKGSDPLRSAAKGPTGPSDSAEDIGLASANGPPESWDEPGA